MKNQAKYALVFSIAYIVVKNIAYKIGIENTEQGKLIGLISLLFVLLTILLTLRENRKTNTTRHFLSDIKLGVKAGGLYSFFIAIYVWFHFSFISPTLNQMLSERVQHQTAMLNQDFFDNKEFVLLDEDFNISLNEKYDASAYESVYIDDKTMMLKNAIDQAKLVFRPMLYSTITLIGLMLLTFFYSIGLAFLLRNVPLF